MLHKDKRMSPEPAPTGAAPVHRTRLLHTMLRVGDLERSLAFYVGLLGMTLFRREDYPTGRFTLAFVGYGSEACDAAIELTHNWDQASYAHGTAYGHVALAVPDLRSACSRLEQQGAAVLRQPGPMSHRSPQRTSVETIAFIADPDGYRVELIEMPDSRRC